MSKEIENFPSKIGHLKAFWRAHSVDEDKFNVAEMDQNIQHDRQYYSHTFISVFPQEFRLRFRIPLFLKVCICIVSLRVASSSITDAIIVLVQ